MLTEKKLLIDTISNAPENSIWNISSDSWEKIPEVFSLYISINDMYGWDITINSNIKEHLIRIIDREEIYDKVVHQDIKFKGEIIFKSYDHMSISFYRKTFPNFKTILKKYKNLDIEELID